MAKSGGVRKGAGRPPGAIAKKSQEILSKAALEGISPLEVMLNDMRFYYNLGEAEFSKIMGRELTEGAAETFKKAHSLKNVARECAQMAAPFIHPRLASIDAKVAVSNQETALAELE